MAERSARASAALGAGWLRAAALLRAPPVRHGGWPSLSGRAPLHRRTAARSPSAATSPCAASSSGARSASSRARVLQHRRRRLRQPGHDHPRRRGRSRSARTSASATCARSTTSSFHEVDPGEGVRRAPVAIGDDVWLARGVVVLPGATIGEGAVIGAGSVVTRHIPPWVVAAGQPARVVREIRTRGGADDRLTAALLFVSPYPPPADGIGSHTRMLVARARASGSRSRSRRPAPRPPRDAADVHRVLALRDAPPRGRRCSPGSAPTRVYVQFSIASYGGALPGLEHLLRLARRAGIPVVTAFHEPRARARGAAGAGPRHLPARRGADRRARRATARPAHDALLAAGIGDGGVTSIPHGVPLLRAAAAEDRARAGAVRPAGRVVLALGFIHPDKGADVLAEAARALLPAHPDVTLVIAGEPRARRGALPPVRARRRAPPGRLREAAAWAGDRVRFPGFVADDDLPDVLAAATVMALPYRRITQSGIAHLCVAGTVPAVASRLDGLEARSATAPSTCRPASRRRSPRRWLRCWTTTRAGRRSARARRPARPLDAGARSPTASSTVGARRIRARRDRSARRPGAERLRRPPGA